MGKREATYDKRKDGRKEHVGRKEGPSGAIRLRRGLSWKEGRTKGYQERRKEGRISSKGGYQEKYKGGRRKGEGAKEGKKVAEGGRTKVRDT